MTPAPAAPEVPDDRPAAAAAYRAHRLRGYQGNLPFVSAVVLAVAGLLVLVLLDRVPRGLLTTWLAGIVLVQGLRVGLGLHHRRIQPAPAADQRWLGWHRLCVLVQGLAWTTAFLLPLPAGDLLGEALRATVVVGLVGGGFALLAFDLLGALCFAVPVMTGLIVNTALMDGPVWKLLAWAGLVTLVLMGLAAHRASRVVQQLVTLQVRSDRQAAALRCSEARLADKSAALEVTLDSISQGITNVDARGRVRVFNRRARELLELPAEACAEGADYDRIRALQVSRGDLPAGGYLDEAGTRQPLPADRLQAPTRYVRRTRAGGLLEVRSRALPDGGLVRTYTDVTEDTLARQALRTAKAEAERAHLAKSQFLAGMSHELRTPLNAIMGFADVLLGGGRTRLPPPQQREVAAIGEGARHLLHLINDLLDLALVESGRLRVERTPVPLAALLQSALDLVQPLARAAGVGLPAAGPALPAALAGARVQADPTRLLQVLLNLLSNAIKYNRRGGTVHLVAAPAVAADGAEATPAWVRLSVQDDGPGLDAAQCQRLFEPFERLGAGPSAAEGVGLGLSLSRALVQAMHGRIGVHSTPGQGSAFWVELPLAADAGADATPAPAAHPGLPTPAQAAEPAGAGEGRQAGAGLCPADTVLYIEDNPVNALLMAAMLAQLGAPQLVVAERGESGLHLARSLQPRLILLDIELPDLHGHVVLQRLRDDPVCRRIPVLAVSANAMPDDITQARAAGFSHYVTKPLALQPLQAAIQATLAQAGSA